MMPEWKRNIFVRAITARMAGEGRTKEDLIAEYVLLTEEEKAEILSYI
ncbi:hypothetical protein [Candidatus Formimonas warabiya]|nr:hypothetical protein [Candidatus Formimonas warabiya]